MGIGLIESILNYHPKVRRAVVKKTVRKDGSPMYTAYLIPVSDREQEQEKPDQFATGDLNPEIINDGDPDLLLDSRERYLFKLRNQGLRFQAGDELREQLGERAGCSLGEQLEAEPVFLETAKVNLRSYPRRSSSQRFLDKPVTFEKLSGFLECLRKAELDGLKKFRYGSAGGLYPVQAYFYIKKNKVGGLKGGAYYYHPFDHALAPIPGMDEMSESFHTPSNQPIYNSSAFTIVLVGKLSAIKPLYGKRSRDFCLIEAGLMAQLLEKSSIENGLGLCQIGLMADDNGVMNFFGLDGNYTLLHVLLGGEVDNEDGWREIPIGTANEPVLMSSSSELIRDIREYCIQRLPEELVPGTFLILDKYQLATDIQYSLPI